MLARPYLDRTLERLKRGVFSGRSVLIARLDDVLEFLVDTHQLEITRCLFEIMSLKPEALLFPQELCGLLPSRLDLFEDRYLHTGVQKDTHTSAKTSCTDLCE